MMFPSDSVIANAFSSQHPLKRQPHATDAADLRKREPFPAWSVIEDTKKKADAFGKEAAREFDIVSQKAQAKTGKIEPWTPKYYAACTVGGLLACVRIALCLFVSQPGLNHLAIGPHPYGRDPLGSRQMPTTGRLVVVQEQPGCVPEYPCG
jgi:hypothetical protein